MELNYYKRDMGKIFTGMTVFYITIVLCVFLVLSILGAIMQMMYGQLMPPTHIMLLLNQFVNYAVGLPVFLLVTKNMSKHKFVAENRQNVSLFSTLRLLSVAVFSTVVFVNLTTSLKNVFYKSVGVNTNANSVDALVQHMPIGWGFFIFCIMVPILEEYMFRQVIFEKVSVYGRNVYILTSATCFSLFHANFDQFGYAFCIGLIFAYIYFKTGRLWQVALLHGVINFNGSVVAMYIQQKKDETITAIYGVFMLLVLAVGAMCFVGIVKRLIAQRHEIFGVSEYKLYHIFANARFVIFALVTVIVAIFALLSPIIAHMMKT